MNGWTILAVSWMALTSGAFIGIALAPHRPTLAPLLIRSLLWWTAALTTFTALLMYPR